MKKNYMKPVTSVQSLRTLHIICGSARGEIVTSPDPADPNSVEIF